MTEPGRGCHLLGIPEISELEPGLDFRKIEYRREVFLRFYEFHTKYNAHPGAVYYAFPYIFSKLGMDLEERYWFCFINGVCQNVVTTYELFIRFPQPPTEEGRMAAFSDFFRSNYKKFGWDTDRRYAKNNFEKIVSHYIGLLNGRSQEDFFNSIMNVGDPFGNFNRVWEMVMKDFHMFGRLSTFSYLEYMRIAGLNIECDSLFLTDIDGSKSHRNGLCKVLGRDDLDWHDKLNPEFDGRYTDEQLYWLECEGAELLAEAGARFPGTTYFTLESTLCCYKSWHRKNRRYPNVYNDMFANRINTHAKNWGPFHPTVKFFWDMRKEVLPEHLRVEDNMFDPGLAPEKQNHYITTGQVIMMDKEWPCFANNFNNYINIQK